MIECPFSATCLLFIVRSVVPQENVVGKRALRISQLNSSIHLVRIVVVGNLDFPYLLACLPVYIPL